MATEACTHRKVTTYRFVDVNQPAGLWACADCGHKFVPLDLCMELDAKRYRYLRENFASVGMGRVELIWDQPDPCNALDGLVDYEMLRMPSSALPL